MKFRQGKLSLNDEEILNIPEECLANEPASQLAVTEIYKRFECTYPKFYKMDLMCKWGFVCAEWLLQDKPYSAIDAYRKAIVMQNRSSSLLTDANFQRSMQQVPSPALFVYTLPNIVMGELAIRHRFKGENTFFVDKQFNPVQLYDYAGLLFQNDIADIVIAAYLEIDPPEHEISFSLLEKTATAVVTP